MRRSSYIAIKVVGAVYGALEGSMDATEVVQSLIDKGYLTFTADNSMLGKDPASGYGKHFGLVYSNDANQIKTVACAEGQTVNITP